MATDRAGGLRDSAGDRAKRIPDSGHRTALRARRAAHDRQRHSPPRRAHSSSRCHWFRCSCLLRVVRVSAASHPSEIGDRSFPPSFRGWRPQPATRRRQPGSPEALRWPTWCFFAGMTALGIDSLFTGLEPARRVNWNRLSRVADGVRFVVKSFVPVIWLCFSLTYSRSNYREFLARWRIPLALVGLLPIGLCARLPRATVSGDAGRNTGRRLVAAVGRDDHSAERHPPRCARPDPDESGTDVPSGRRHDALADQVRRAGPGGDLRRSSLRSKPGDSLLRAGHRSVGHRVRRAPDRLRLPDARLRANAIGRDRRVSLARPSFDRR